MKNKFMELYDELERQERFEGFIELKEFLHLFTQQLSSRGAWELVKQLMSEDELRDYLNSLL